MVLVCAGMTVLFSVLSIRLVHVQLVQHKRYSESAERYYVHKENLPASRGTITDRNGELLARSQTVYTLYADAYHLRSYMIGCLGVAAAEGVGLRAVRRKYSHEEIQKKYLDRVISVMAEPLGYLSADLRMKLLGKATGEVILIKGLEEDEHRRIQTLLERESVGGIYFKTGTRRFYPSPHVLTHVIGYVNENGQGMEGVEKVFDGQMRRGGRVSKDRTRPSRAGNPGFSARDSSAAGWSGYSANDRHGIADPVGSSGGRGMEKIHARKDNSSDHGSLHRRSSGDGKPASF